MVPTTKTSASQTLTLSQITAHLIIEQIRLCFVLAQAQQARHGAAVRISNELPGDTCDATTRTTIHVVILTNVTLHGTLLSKGTIETIRTTMRPTSLPMCVSRTMDISVLAEDTLEWFYHCLPIALRAGFSLLAIAFGGSQG